MEAGTEGNPYKLPDEDEESDSEFIERVRVERVKRDQASKAFYRGVLLIVVPLVLLFANCVVVPLACNRVKEYRDQQSLVKEGWR